MEVPFCYILSLEINFLMKRMKQEFVEVFGIFGNKNPDRVIFNEYQSKINILGERLSQIINILENNLYYGFEKKIKIPQKSENCEYCLCCIVKDISLQGLNSDFTYRMEKWPDDVQKFVYDYLFMKYDFEIVEKEGLKKYIVKYIVNNPSILLNELFKLLK